MMQADRVFEKLEDATMGALEDYMAFRVYQGTNGEYYKRARLGIPVLSTYGRVRGTRANERQLALLESRFASGEPIGDLSSSLADQPTQALPAHQEAGTATARDTAKAGARERGGKS